MNEKPLQNSEGFIYVASGEAYLREAEASARSLQAVMPNAAISLVTDSTEYRNDLFENIFIESVPDSDFMHYKLTMRRSPYQKTLYLDTDTYITEPLDSIFALLDRFDVALNPLTKVLAAEAEGVPPSLPEFNAGVIAFRQSPLMAEFFERWDAMYVDLKARRGIRSDQVSLRKALFETDVRFAPLPNEDNFLIYFPLTAANRIRIFHGRPLSRIKKLEAEMNRRLGRRALVPKLGCLRPYYQLTWREKLALSGRSTLLLVQWCCERIMTLFGLGRKR